MFREELISVPSGNCSYSTREFPWTLYFNINCGANISIDIHENEFLERRDYINFCEIINIKIQEISAKHLGTAIKDPKNLLLDIHYDLVGVFKQMSASGAIYKDFINRWLWTCP